jgi:hypothetical protein
MGDCKMMMEPTTDLKSEWDDPKYNMDAMYPDWDGIDGQKRGKLRKMHPHARRYDFASADL